MKLLSEQIMYKEKEMLVQYLVKMKSAVSEEWSKAIIVHEDDPYKEKIIENGLKLYALVLDLIEGFLFEEHLERLANEVTKERLEANVNIGQLVNNANIGRSIIIKYVFKANILAYDLELYINNINTLFDTFNYYAVTKYTNMKNKMIEEKDDIINENYKDKLVLLGQISASFLHEFRNPLTSIMGFNKLLKRENPNLEYLDIMDYELQQMNFRIAQFLHTSRGKFNTEQKENVSINGLVHEMSIDIYKYSRCRREKRQIDISSEFFVVASREEMKQVLLNLFINAIDALGHIDQPRYLKVHSYTTSEEQVDFLP